MTLTPQRSVPAKPPKALHLLEEAGGGELPDIRLSMEERQLVKRVITRLEQRLSVDALMFAAGGFEDAAIRARRAEQSRRA